MRNLPRSNAHTSVNSLPWPVFDEFMENFDNIKMQGTTVKKKMMENLFMRSTDSAFPTFTITATTERQCVTRAMHRKNLPYP